MNNIYIRNSVRFVLLVLLQVFVFNKIYLGGYLNPYVFLMFIVLLPFETPWWLLLLSSFGIGLTIDIFTGSLGMHAAAATLLAFARPTLINILLPKRDRNITVFPGIGFMGLPTFTLYTFILILIHHFLFFSMEAMSWFESGTVIIRVLLSALLSTFMIVLLELIFRRKNG